MKIVFPLIFNFLLFQATFSQNESNVWIFGNDAGIDFNTEPPSSSYGWIDSQEGCASICDNEGNLLFYTDGIEVRNRNHQVMPNGGGLLGQQTTTQSSLIIRNPLQDSIYTIFTVRAHAGAIGIRYSEVNMDLQGGFGDVTAVKNQFIVNNTCEKIIAVKHQNGIDWWIVVNLYESNTFLSYLFNQNGINISSPLSSNVGTVISQDPLDNNVIGYMKSNINGTKIATAYQNLKLVELFEIDNSTGVLSNPISFSFSYQPYGIEFSPNGSFLYVSEIGSGSGSDSIQIHQFDLNLNSPMEIDTNRILIGENYSRGGALKLGPDLKIYQARFNKTTLGVINNPNELGLACNYDSAGFSLGFNQSKWGLPNTVNTLNFDPLENILVTDICFSDSTAFNFSSIYADSLSWFFGDPASGSANFSNLDNPKHLFSDTGYFDVTTIVHSEIAPDTVVNTYRIVLGADLELGNDTTLCKDETLLLNVADDFAFYQWQNGSTDSTFLVSENGSYNVSVNQLSCVKEDSINVDYTDIPKVDILQNDTILCFGDTLNLKTSTSLENINYQWQDNSALNYYNVNQTGSYMVAVSNICGDATDEVNIDYKECRCAIKIPDAFSPNGDGINDSFYPILEFNNAIITKFNIYNRWGALVHSNLKPWNGKLNEKDQKSEVYNYFISFDCNGEVKTLNGSITLLR